MWTDAESLRHFTYRSGHASYFRRRREWFAEGSSKLVCWWIPTGTTPTVEEAIERLELLERNGPGEHAFTLSTPVPTPT